MAVDLPKGKAVCKTCGKTFVYGSHAFPGHKTYCVKCNPNVTRIKFTDL